MHASVVDKDPQNFGQDDFARAMRDLATIFMLTTQVLESAEQLAMIQVRPP